MKLTLIQPEGKNISDFRQAAFHILQLTKHCCQTDTDLILLPECAFPGYFIGLAPDDEWKTELSKFSDSIGSLSAQYGKYIGIGLPYIADGHLYNSLVLYNRFGTIINTAHKSNLWHFDSQWFEPGQNFTVIDTEFGKIGSMVCADGRIPEIARSLRLQGARLILDSVNLVASAMVPSQLSNQQYTFMLRERARENRVFIAVCDKCGVEDSCVTMLGRSMIIDPFGNVIAECGPEHEEILCCEIDLLKEYPLPERKKGEYDILTMPTENLPVIKEIEGKFSLKELECYTAVVRFPWSSIDEYAVKAKEYVMVAQKANCRLTVLPYAQGVDLSPILKSLCEFIIPGSAVVTGYGSGQCAALYHGCTIYKSGDTLDKRIFPLFDGVNLAALFDAEMEIPENPRVCMLHGADVLIWFDSATSPSFQMVMQTRSAENKVYCLRTTPCDQDDFSLITGPDGSIAATTFRCQNHVAFGMIYTALSRSKTVVPGTDIIQTRIPEAYEHLI